MLKKLDSLVLRAFIPPFILTLAVVVFILLTQFMLKYFDDFVGKDLPPSTYAELLFFFSINSLPLALPISILLSSIMTYGNLSEHNELTAIKSAGISLLRVIRPVFFLVCLLTLAAFYINNRVVPLANLRAYSLLYDITTKKAAFNIKEGTFYYGLPGFAVKINSRHPDGKTIEGIMIYNHQEERGNVNLTLADSGKMYTIWNDRYLILELFRGRNYSEVAPAVPGGEKEFTQNRFQASKLVFNLSSFEMSRTDIQLFATNKIMRNLDELSRDLDSLRREQQAIRKNLYANYLTYYSYYRRPAGTLTLDKPALAALRKKLDLSRTEKAGAIHDQRLSQVRSFQSFSESYLERLKTLRRDVDVFSVEKYRKYTQSAACLVLFLVGAPLGSIIKKGGFGIPVLISIVFFILYYVFSITGEKWSKENVVDVPQGMWASNVILLGAGLFFLRKAWNDSTLLDNNYITRVLQMAGDFLTRFRRKDQAG